MQPGQPTWCVQDLPKCAFGLIPGALVAVRNYRRPAWETREPWSRVPEHESGRAGSSGNSDRAGFRDNTGPSRPRGGRHLAGVVIVTGASAGIGKACADRLHGNGWKVFGASRRGTSSGGWVPIKMDVDDDAKWRRRSIRDRRDGASRRRDRLCRLGPCGTGREHADQCGQGAARDELLGSGAPGQSRAPFDAVARRRQDRLSELSRGADRPSVPSVLQRKQVRDGGLRRSSRIRGGALWHSRDTRRTGKLQDRFHREPA